MKLQISYALLTIYVSHDMLINASCQDCSYLRNCFKDVRPSDKFDNPYLIIPWVTNDNSEHLCEPVSWTCFRVLCTLLYLHEHCPYITYYCFCCQSFIYNFTKMLAVSINLQHSHCNIVFLIIQFKLLSLHFFYHIKKFYF